MEARMKWRKATKGLHQLSQEVLIRGILISCSRELKELISHCSQTASRLDLDNLPSQLTCRNQKKQERSCQRYSRWLVFFTPGHTGPIGPIGSIYKRCYGCRWCNPGLRAGPSSWRRCGCFGGGLGPQHGRRLGTVGQLNMFLEAFGYSMKFLHYCWFLANIRWKERFQCHSRVVCKTRG